MKKPTGLPEILFVGRQYKIRHQHVVFEVMEFNEDTTPKTLRLMDPNEVVDLSKDPAAVGNRCFMTGYVQERSLAPWEHLQKREEI